MTRVLVTGASGFIGSNLTRNLIKTKDQVNVLVRKKSNLWRINDVLSECSIHTVDLSDFEETRNSLSLCNFWCIPKSKRCFQDGSNQCNWNFKFTNVTS